MGETHILVWRTYISIEAEADEAIRDAKKGVELGSEAPASHNVLGEAFLWKGDNVRAAAEFNRAIGLSSTKAAADSKGAFELNNAKFDSHTRLGDVYYLEGKYELAKAEFDQALKLATSVELQYLDGPIFFLPWLRRSEGA